MESQSTSERSPEATESDEGLLVGTAAEEAPGVGGVGDHPAPAAMRDPESGAVRVAGSGPGVAPSSPPAGESSDEASGDGVDPEARERLDAVVDHEPYETERPDLGTE